MAVNPIKKQPDFCWLCYRESVARFAPGLPTRGLRSAVLAAAAAHKMDGGLVPTPFEHRRHPGAAVNLSRPLPALAVARELEELAEEAS